jgi:uncharacterized protein YndB with AHSA1/START domain
MPDIHHIFFVQSNPQKVFDAFCTERGLNSWWTLESKGQPVPGNMYTFYFGPEYDWSAEVVHCIPGKELTWRMRETMDDWKRTQVGFQLSEKNKGTSVAFFHTGWREANEHFGITNFCWAMLLNGLKNYVERGLGVPHASRN